MERTPRYILTIDPSGDGTSGFCLCEIVGELLIVKNVSHISIKDFGNTYWYWLAHINKINYYTNLYKDNIIIVIEDFTLNKRKSKQFVNSDLPTSKLIGALELKCFSEEIPYKVIKPKEYLSLITDQQLCDESYIKRTPKGFELKDGVNLSRHNKDSLKLAVYYFKYKRGETNGI